MRYFREHALLDYYAGGFDGPAEGLLLVYGSIQRAVAPIFIERLQRVARDFALQHQSDSKAPAAECEGYTLLLTMRRWELEAFRNLNRTNVGQPSSEPARKLPRLCGNRVNKL
jgi:hypothetical protein